MSFSTSEIANAGDHRSSDYSSLPSVRLSCEDVISKCDAAIAAKNKHIEKLELGLTTQTQRVADLSSQLEDKNSELQSWYRNPFVVGALGLVAGAAVITFAK